MESKQEHIFKPYIGEKTYCFISYAHSNKIEVLNIIERLLNDKYRIWFDEGIDPGTEWADDIAQQILGSECILAFISKEYIVSENCRDELSFARENGIKIILIYMENIELPGGMALRNHRSQALFFDKYLEKDNFYKKLYTVKELERCKASIINIKHNKDLNENIDFLNNSKSNNDLINLNNNIKETMKLGYHEKDNKKIFQSYILAESQGSTDAKVKMGICYKYGIGTKKNKKRAYHMFEDAAILGNAVAFEYLAYEYQDGKNVKKDLKRALELLEKSYEAGNYQVADEIGEIYDNGITGILKTDRIKAVKWYNRAINNGYGEFVVSRLGQIYLNGEGIPKDEKKAEKIFLLDENDWLGESSYYLGIIYYQGRGVLKDKKKGLYYLNKSANIKENIDAALELEKIYREGDGVKKDTDLSKKWYKKAVNLNNISMNEYLKTKNGKKDVIGICLQVFIFQMIMYTFLKKILEIENFSLDEFFIISNFLFLISTILKEKYTTYILDILFYASFSISIAILSTRSDCIIAITFVSELCVGIIIKFLFNKNERRILQWTIKERYYIWYMIYTIIIAIGKIFIYFEVFNEDVVQVMGFILFGAVGLFLMKIRNIFFIGICLAFIALGMMGGNIYNKFLTNNIFVEVSKDTLESKKIGKMKYTVSKNWNEEIQKVDKEVIYDLRGVKEWDHIYIYYIDNYINKKSNPDFSDYRAILNKERDSNTVINKILVSGVKGYFIQDVIIYDATKYYREQYFLIYDRKLYIISCSSENPPNKEFLADCKAVIQSIQFMEEK